ncbi:hypothetical protein SLAV_25210 [Streptomyces lavendulae subsp. lavendulae]|uniref:Uncharacterized protein n=1 Tax=Streptomyces lavendulae subsp. lavendulae TaxID=58340 RepID=A0A2K8PJC7_STRLA|nr:hypothetical protein [Streptomyces lavendulae]ATZ26836.1 hypothetical protein SLAV_25210 [Streptomyces lavendulae subsp. lavendulae]QUQ56663.1 hypothetical protein SLLC_23340 [Streptomyces lavendulae subsp. lavendulae]
MSETLHDRQRRWAESLPLLSNELTELACVLADEEPRKIGVHLLWPLFVELFRAEADADPDPAALGVVCNCPEHF